MTTREYNAIVKRYQDQIERELAQGQLHVNKDGYIKKSVVLSRDLTNGKKRRIQVEGISSEDCAKKLADKYKALLEKTDEILESKTFGEVAEEWYKVEIENAGISYGNKQNYKNDLKRNILPYLQHCDITQLKKKEFQLFLNRFSGKGESSVKKIRMTLMRIIRYAMENEYMPERLITLTLPSVKEIEKRKILTEGQIKLLFRSVEKYPPAFTYIVLLATGLRPCEAYHVEYKDIDFEKKLLFVKKSKTENGIRIIPLPTFCVDLINADREKLQEEGKTTNYVFHQLTNCKLAHTATSLSSNWRTTLRTMDILNGATLHRNRIVQSSLENKDLLSPYSLRHTYCTMLNDCGIGDYFKKRLMGHTLKDSITDSVYTHSSDEKLIKATTPFLKYIQQIYDESSQSQ